MIEETLAFRLLKAVKSTRQDIWPVLTELGLHPGQDLMLSELWREDGITQGELAARLGIEAPTVSKAVNRLERVGYLRREPGPRGARRVFVTDEGMNVREAVEDAWRTADAKLIDSLSTEEQEALKNLVSRLPKVS